MQAEGVYGDYMAKLQVKQSELKVITDKLNALQDDLTCKQTEKQVKTNKNNIVDHVNDFKPFPTKLIYLNFLSLEVV